MDTLHHYNCKFVVNYICLIHVSHVCVTDSHALQDNGHILPDEAIPPLTDMSISDVNRQLYLYDTISPPKPKL
jgi:hypothetical protein